MLRVLIIGYVWPEPCSSAAGSRMLELIDLFRLQAWHVVFATPAIATHHQVDLAERGVECRSIALNCDSFDTFVAELEPGIVLFDRFMMEEQFGWRVARACPSALRVLDTEDLHSLRQARQRLLQATLSSNGASRTKRIDWHDGEERHEAAIAKQMCRTPSELFSAMAMEEMAYREVAAIHRSDLSLIISEFEVALLTEHFGVPEAGIHYCPFMLDVASGPTLDFENRGNFVSIGNFRHAPNWDAVLWLKERLWPAIRAQLPGVEVHIYGAYPPPKATALDSPRDGFRVKGWAENAQEVLSQSRLCLAPLRFGAGLKGKLVDAMVAGTPTITTPIGAEGIRDHSPWPGVIAADTQAFIAGAISLYSSHENWVNAQEDGYRLLERRFARQQHGPALIERLLDRLANLEAYRQDNFTGSMLRHHFHQSTHYMSRWIDAKNRLQQVTGR